MEAGLLSEEIRVTTGPFDFSLLESLLFFFSFLISLRDRRISTFESGISTVEQIETPS
jgi:hypothetical protein